MRIWFLVPLFLRTADASAAAGKERQLTQTPTWAVALVCTFFIIVSVLLEKCLHKLGSWLWNKHKRALLDALEKVKAELSILGFISLLITFGERYLLKICIPENAARTMLPCAAEETDDNENHRRLLWFDHRLLNSDTSTNNCKEDFEPLISSAGLHQLHLLLFFLGVFHVLYSFLTMMLGKLKIRGWKKWEQGTLSRDYDFSVDPSRFRLAHETSFVRAHTSFWTKIPLFFYVGCFFRQFFRSVSETDYLTLRHGFIAVVIGETHVFGQITAFELRLVVHLAPGRKFNFQKYIKRSLEDDYKVVVGISPILWASFVFFLLLNVNGWKTLLWASILPVIIILAVGSKLQIILTKMALQITERHAVVQGMPLVQGSDRYFWFSKPQLLLHLIHFCLFQNAFQITYFFWIWYCFSLHSCFHSDLKLAIVKLSLSVGGLLLCSYITLPLYALVTQMGSHMKKAVFDEQTTKALKNWHMTVKNRKGKAGKHTTKTLGGSGSVSVTTSTVHSSSSTFLRSKTIGHSTVYSSTYDDPEVSDLEAEPFPTTLEAYPDDQKSESESEMMEMPPAGGSSSHGDDFSFARPSQFPHSK